MNGTIHETFPTPLFDDDLMTLPEAAKLLPRNSNGKAVSVQTLRRWANRGSRGVRLSLTMVGGRSFVGRHALRDFLGRTQVADRRVVNTSLAVGARRAAARLAQKGA